MGISSPVDGKAHGKVQEGIIPPKGHGYPEKKAHKSDGKETRINSIPNANVLYPPILNSPHDP